VLRLLRRRDFGLLWVGGLVSIAGDWVLNAALPYFVYARTGSTLATAGMVAAELAPGIFLGSVAGVFVDRWDRKRLLVVANVLQAAAVALLLLVPGGGWIGFAYVTAAAVSLVSSFSVPAESALLPTLVTDEELVPANALNALNNRLGRLIGLPIGGAVLGLAGLRGVVLVDMASFAGAAVLISLISSQRVAERALEVAEAAVTAWAAFWRQWLEGLRIIRRERAVALVFFVLGLMTFGGTMLDPLDPAWVRSILDQGPGVYSLLLTAHAVTGIVGALVVGRFGDRLTPRTQMGWGSIAAGTVLLVKYNTPVLPLAFALTLPIGITSVASAVGAQTVVQRTIPDAYRGRVFGSLGATGALLSLLGAVVGGFLGGAVGIVPGLDVAAALTILAGAVVLRAFRPATAGTCTPPSRRDGECPSTSNRGRPARRSGRRESVPRTEAPGREP
jgi:MFS family permease